MNHSTKRPTKAEQVRLDALHCLPCLACAFEIEEAKREGKPHPGQPLQTEADHLVDKGTRKLSGGHAATIPLCGWHHQGTCYGVFTQTQMARIYGPSKKLSKKAFERRYGGPRIMLVETDALIASNRHTEFA
jgi:hypothetical protein